MSADTGSDTTLFLDANILISAAWKEGSEIAQIWRLEGVRLVTSNFVMGEVQRNLHQVAQIERLRVLMRQVRILTFERFPVVDEAVELPEKDRPVLEGAIQAKVDHLVTGDKKHFGTLYGRTIRGVRITAPSELLALLRFDRS
jgi:predicted nucleic acid-binding protein